MSLTPSYRTPRWLRSSLAAWRSPSLTRWTLAWTLGGVILGCSAVPDVIGEGGGILPLGTSWSFSKGVPVPPPDTPEDDAVAISQPLPEPGIPGLASTFMCAGGALAQDPAWVPHLGPAAPEVLGLAPKTGPPV